MKRHLLCYTAIAGAVLVAPATSSAQQQAQGQQAQISAIEEIVVTSRRREENLQVVPLSIAAFSANMLEQRNVFRFEEIADYVPNLIMTDSERVNISSIEIRGIGGGGPLSERSFGTGIYIDGMYISDSSGAYNSTFGIERIEVLRGPQGTLFGRNTTGGLINIVTQRPGPDPDNRLNLEYGRFNLMRVSMAGNLTFVPDKLYGRLGLNYESDDGYYKDLNTGEGYSDIENRTGKMSIRWLPNDNWTIDFSGSWSYEPRHANGGNCIYAGTTTNQNRANTGLTAAGRPTVQQLCAQSQAGLEEREFYADPQGKAFNETRFVTLQPVWDSNGPVGMFDNVTLSMNLGYRFNNNLYYADGDYLNARVSGRASGINGRTNTSKSAELLFNGVAIDGRLDLTAGLYYYDDTRGFKGQDCARLYETVAGTGNSVYCANPGSSVWFDDIATFTGIYTGNQQVLGIPNVGNENKSAFAHISYDITDKLKFDIGGRYSSEYKSMRSIDVYLTRAAEGYILILNDNVVSNVVDAEDTWKRFTPKASLTYAIDEAGALDSAIVYASWATGFLSGGFNNEGGEELLDAFPSFGPEDVDSYEIGAKTNWLDNRVRINVAAFYSDYRNRQEGVTIDNGPGGANGLFGAEETPGVTISIGKSKIKGFEWESNWNIIDNLLVDFNFSYIKTKNSGQDASGIPDNILPFVELDTSSSTSNAPRWRANWGVSYTFDMPSGATITPRINGNYVQGNRIGADTQPELQKINPFTGQKGMCYVGAYTQWNGRVTWENADRDMSVALYATNLTDLTRYIRCSDGRGTNNAPSGFGIGFVTVHPPLRWGLQTSFRF